MHSAARTALPVAMLPDVTARPGGDGDQTVDLRLCAFSRMSIADDVVEDESAVAVDRVDDLGVRRQREHDDRNAMPDDHVQIRCQTVVAAVGDQIDRVRNFAAGEFRLDPADVRVQVGRGARIQGRHRADDAGSALGDHEVGRGSDEHRSGHDRYPKLGSQPSGECGVPSKIVHSILPTIGPAGLAQRVRRSAQYWRIGPSYGNLVNWLII
jgi:hypothetical protein